MIIITRKIDTHPLAEIIRLIKFHVCDPQIHPMCWDELYRGNSES